MKLENERYEMTFCTKGGEMLSFLDKQTGIQYLYQGDSEYWSGKNPTLFPMVGNTFSGSYELNETKYAMKNHGLIRYAELTCIHHDEQSITFELRDNDETRKQYPFSFCYHVTYRLEGNRCTITYEITNTSAIDMPFTFGLHPAFKCPLCQAEQFSDYTLHFDQMETAVQILPYADKKQPPQRIERSFQDLPLSHDWILDASTIIYEGLKSAYVTLQGKQYAVKVSIAGYPLLAIWTPHQNAPFVCIEPWYGHGDFYDVQVPFAQREGMMMLSPGKMFTTSYQIEVL